MQIHKKRIKKEDGRYLIYYTFTEEDKEKEAKGVSAKMELYPKIMEYNSGRFNNSCYSTFNNFPSFSEILY